MSNTTDSCKMDKIQCELEHDVLLNMGHKKYKASMAYARALFQFARETNLLELISESFGNFISVLQELSVLRQFIRCDAIDRNTRKERIRHFFKNHIHKVILCFIEKVIDNNHTEILPGIYYAFCQMVDEVNYRRRIRVLSAFPLNNSQKKQLQEALEKFLEMEVILNNEVDQDVMGGFVCYTDSIKIDMSLKKDFEKLKSQILSTPCKGDRKI
jgi:F-type H+-transporting ATPase subunit delta